MIKLDNINFKYIKDKFQVPKPWDNVIIFVLNVLIAIPVFIISHQNFVDPDWYFEIDRILLFIIIVTIIQFVLRALRTIMIICILLYLLALFFGSIFGSYGFFKVANDYRSMMYTMADDPNPQDIIISKLLPFPNKSKIIKAVDFYTPNVRNFALMTTTKHFKNIKNFNKYRVIIQSFAAFKEIQDKWNYVNDPRGEEYIAKASESLQHFSGDCDDHAILMAASVRAVGGIPRLISTQDHIYPEILIGSKGDFENIHFLIKEVLFKEESKGKKIHYHIDERGQIWLNLDYTAKYPGGPFLSEEILGALTLF